MSARLKIIRAMMERRGIPPTPFNPRVALEESQRAPYAMERTKSLLRDVEGDRAAAIAKAQNTLDRYLAAEPISDKNARVLGKHMRQNDEVMNLLQSDKPIDPWTYGIAGAVPLGAGMMGGLADTSQAATPATFDQRWWPQ